MPAVDAAIVFLPRPTTLVGAPSGTYDFPTLPLDVSQYGGAQFQIWRGPMSGGTFTVFLEESLDAQTWVLGPSTPTGFVLTAEEQKFFSYGFRLRWFRLRIRLSSEGAAYPVVTCWAEGLLRGGGSGAWPSPLAAGSPVAPPSPTEAGAAGSGAAATGGERLEDSFVYTAGSVGKRGPTEIRVPVQRM